MVDGNDSFRQGQHATAQAPRHLSAGRPRRAGHEPRRPEVGGDKVSSSWSARKIPGGKLTSQQLLAELDLVRRVGQCHAAHHHPAGLAVSRRLKDTFEGGDPPDQRGATYYAGRLRRRRAQHHVLPRAASSRSGARRDASNWLTGSLRTSARAPAPITKYGLPIPRRGEEQRSSAAVRTAMRSSRSTARPICRANSRRPSACPATIASTSTPTISA